MAGFGLSVVDINGCAVVMNSEDAMYVRAQQAGDTELMRILEERAERKYGKPPADVVDET